MVRAFKMSVPEPLDDPKPGAGQADAFGVPDIAQEAADFMNAQRALGPPGGKRLA